MDLSYNCQLYNGASARTMMYGVWVWLRGCTAAHGDGGRAFVFYLLRIAS